MTPTARSAALALAWLLAPALAVADQLPARRLASALRFEALGVRPDGAPRFVARGPGYAVFLTPTETILSFMTALNGVRGRQPGFLSHDRRPRVATSSSVATIRMRLAGARDDSRLVPAHPQTSPLRRFVGADPGAWRTHLTTYAAVRRNEVYPGIDLLYYGADRQLEYDFIVAPGADPAVIEVEFEGADRLHVDDRGDLMVTVGEHEFRQRRPVAYQDIGGTRQPVASSYAIDEAGRVSFALGEYDARHALTIDPIVIYSTYLGGTERDAPPDIGNVVLDAAGNAYVSGQTSSDDFPATAGTPGGNGDAFLTKFSPSGEIVYSLHFGGRGADDVRDVAVDWLGNVYLGGATQSPDFPTTPGTIATVCTPIGDTECSARGFVIKINAAGTALMYSTLLGGASPEGYPTVVSSIAVNGIGVVTLVGSTGSGLTATPGAFQTSVAGLFDGFAARLNGTGSSLTWVTYFGGRSDEFGARVALDANGSAYVTGTTHSTDFPTSAGAYQRDCPVLDIVVPDQCSIAFVIKFTRSGMLAYSTYLGGRTTIGAAIRGVSSTGEAVLVDQQGAAWIVGTSFTTDFPTTADAFLKDAPGGWNAFLTKLSSDGASLLYSTYHGGSTEDYGEDIATDLTGAIYVAGTTTSADFPSHDASQPSHGGGVFDVFVTKFDATGRVPTYSTFLGGAGEDWLRAIAVDAAGTVYVTGSTDSDDFPTVDAAQPLRAGSHDAFVTRLGLLTCGTDVTEHVDVLPLPSLPLLLPFLQIQLVFVHSRSASTIAGPVALVLDDLQNGALVQPAPRTSCYGTPDAPWVVLTTGDDSVLSPGEIVATLLLFRLTEWAPIRYVPRVISGLPTQ
jgi:hypothetical protein